MGNQDSLLGQADAHAGFALHHECQTFRVNQDDFAWIRNEHSAPVSRIDSVHLLLL